MKLVVNSILQIAKCFFKSEKILDFYPKSCSPTSDYDSIRSEDIKHVWYFEPILEHIVFICNESPTNGAFQILKVM